uniref:Transcription factor MYC2 n=1 Tax=Aquilaria malaccensis TaxID=223753 RepID=A0A4Y6GMT4_9ROSI|nr:transcription factor MYC2 [Aquilaria malaccensis]
MKACHLRYYLLMWVISSSYSPPLPTENSPQASSHHHSSYDHRNSTQPPRVLAYCYSPVRNLKNSSKNSDLAAAAFDGCSAAAADDSGHELWGDFQLNYWSSGSPTESPLKHAGSDDWQQ